MSNLETGQIYRLDGSGSVLLQALYQAGVRKVYANPPLVGELPDGSRRTVSFDLPSSSMTGGGTMTEVEWDRYVAYVRDGGFRDPLVGSPGTELEFAL